MHAMETINRKSWSDPFVLRDYQHGGGYLNAGEAAALDAGFALAPGRRVLDIGVGGGRTSALLRDRAESYLGIDYTPEMITLARRKNPDLRLELMDARDLSGLPEGAFDVAFFSYNGIDSVNPEGRLRAMAAVERVLAPGGVFVFSTFHRGWSGFSRRVGYRRLHWTRDPVRLVLRAGAYATRSATGFWRKFRHARLEERDAEHAIMLHGAHDFGILVYATTPEQADRQLRSSGFEAPHALLDLDGNSLARGIGPAVEYFYVVARKPGA
ncbi:SAM-dependent methyltransferase [Rhizobium azooxidifex]|uniref:SAM-dependent methyltransferase n=1 Tax=Mycoplana azooxidifex TaxID=1636188 RepID=A0A7W6GGQ5_9HYPH|nr:class I SAM-dependent methyltransferase [Mycoplana azooxidifex]MBB3975151.1 SAM-dependent methyltransferase [Mycoplana azooxidifex]